jgi:hypothetical protein
MVHGLLHTAEKVEESNKKIDIDADPNAGTIKLIDFG